MAIAIWFTFDIALISRTFPYTDEWGYIERFTAHENLLGYAFRQHNDHRIPIQKLTHIALLELTGFDFRSLLVSNILLAAAMALIFMVAAKSYRGRFLLGDLAIPLTCLGFGSGMTFYGFEGQFLLSNFMLALFLLFSINSDRGRHPFSINMAMTSLMLLAWTGMNGVIVSLLLSISVAAFFISKRASAKPLTLILLFFALAMNAALIAFWKPSSPTIGSGQFHRIIEYAIGIFASVYPVFINVGYWVTVSVLSVLLLTAVVLGLKSLLSSNLTDLSAFVLLASVASCIAMILSVAYGRAQISEWANGVGMHYGYLAIPVAIVTWIVVSKHAHKYVVSGFGLVLLSLSAYAFYYTAQWRVPFATQEATKFFAATNAIRSNETADEVARDHSKSFYPVDTPQIQELIAQGIETLRRIGGRKYHND